MERIQDEQNSQSLSPCKHLDSPCILKSEKKKRKRGLNFAEFKSPISSSSSPGRQKDQTDMVDFQKLEIDDDDELEKRIHEFLDGLNIDIKDPKDKKYQYYSQKKRVSVITIKQLSQMDLDSHESNESLEQKINLLRQQSEQQIENQENSEWGVQSSSSPYILKKKRNQCPVLGTLNFKEIEKEVLENVNDFNNGSDKGSPAYEFTANINQEKHQYQVKIHKDEETKENDAQIIQ